MPKRPPPAERVPITDEWGIYDPAKAGMQAVYARLGRPALRASSKHVRQERRRGFRPERPNDGVGLAIEEAMRRAGILIEPTPMEEPIATVSAGRAVRLALEAARMATPLKIVDDLQAPAGSAAPAGTPVAAPRRKSQHRAKAAAVPPAESAATPSVVEIQAAVAEPDPEHASRARTSRKTAKARTKVETAPAVPAAPPGPPAPSPRRPRGPVPLAAWAHAVAETPTVEPRRVDKRGFWRALFRIPAEVALVEYAHGCRIHRLLIETSDVPSHDLP